MNNIRVCSQIESRLADLRHRIDAGGPGLLRHPEQAEMPEWVGADVRITSDFLYEPPADRLNHDLLVRTTHAVALTWLVLKVRDAFQGLLDHTNKYGFYGSLAEAALAHLGTHQPESADPAPLLRAVHARAVEWLDVVRSEGRIPPNAECVIHLQDEEGRQTRLNAENGEATN